MKITSAEMIKLIEERHEVVHLISFNHTQMHIMKHRIHCSFIVTRYVFIEVLKNGIEAKDDGNAGLWKVRTKKQIIANPKERLHVANKLLSLMATSY